MSYMTKQNQRERGARFLARNLLCGVSAVAAIVALSAPSGARAEDRYWDANGTTVGSGGAGTWDLGNLNWSPSGDGVSGPYTPWNNATLDDAIFGGTAGTVTLDVPVTVHNLTFNTAGYTLSGSTLTLAGLTPTITNGGTTTINSIIAGSAGLTKAGAGALVLNGINTFLGDIYLNIGSINAASDAALGAASNNIFTGAGTSVGLTISGASTNRTVTIGNGGLLNLGGSGVGSALITGNGRVSVGNGVTLSNDASTYTGSTTFNGVNGVANSYFTSIGNLGEASSLGAPTTVSDGTIVFDQSSQYSDNVIYLGDGDSSNRNWALYGGAALIRNRGTGTLSITGDVYASGGSGFYAESADIDLLGVLSGVNYNFNGNAGRVITLGGANTFTGAANIGTITTRASVLADIGTASSFGAGSGAISIAANGALSYIGAGASSNRAWTIASGSLLNDGTGALALSGAVGLGTVASNKFTLGGSYAGTNTLSGIISGTGSLISNGSGTWLLGGANTYTGSVTVESGTLVAGNAQAFGTPNAAIVNGGTLDLGGFATTFTSLSGTGGGVALAGADLTVDGSTSTGFAGSITGTGSLLKRGTSTLTLTGANTYTGATTINGGAITLDFSPAGGPTDNILSNASALVMSGGALNIKGAGDETNGQSFSGLIITAGSNRISATSGAGGSLTVNLGAITRTGGLIDFAVPASGNITTSNTSLGGWATINGADYAKIVGGNITAFTAADYTGQDDASLWATGQFITDDDGHAGSFYNIVNGSVQLGGLRYTQAAASTVTIDSGQTLGVDGTIIVAATVGNNNQTITGGSLTGASGGSVLGLQQNGGGTFTIDSTIVDNGGDIIGFTKAGTGTAALTGANTYTGATTLSGGKLQITGVANAGSASSIGAASTDSSNLVLESGTLAFVGGANSSTDRGFTLVNGGAGTPTIEVNSASIIEFSGLVTSADDAGLTKTGAGTLVLSNAANDYVGVTTVSGAAGAGGASVLSVNTLTNGGLASGIGAATSDSANLVLAAGGRLQYTGGTVGIDRGFTLDTGSGRIDVAQAATTLTVSGTAVGVGGLIKEGDGVLVLSGTNTYSGGTTVNGGTLRAGSIAAFGSEIAPMAVNTGAVFDLGGFNITVGALRDGDIGGGTVLLGASTLIAGGANGTFSGTISGSGGFTRANGGTQILSGCNNTYTGVTTINGTLSIDCLANGGFASGIGASGSDSVNLVFNTGALSYTGASVTTDRGFTLQSGANSVTVTNGATTLEFQGQVVGAGALSKSGTGTLVLSGANTYAGSTRVSGGILRAGSAQAFGAPNLMTLDNVAGVALDLAGFSSSFSALNAGGSTGGNIILGSADLTITAGNSGANYAGAITGTGNLIKNGSAVQRLSGCASDYSGSTTINGGAIEVTCLVDGGVASSIGSSSADASSLVLNGGTLRYVGTGSSTNRQFTLGASGGNVLDASGTGAITFANNAPLTFSNPNTAQTLTLRGTNTGNNILAAQITNNGTGVTALTKTDAGTWNLTNPASSYTGITTISGGVLGVDKLADGGLASSLGASSSAASNLVIGNGSTLRYTGAGDTTNRLFTLAAGTTFIESSGTGAVVFTDTGLVTLAGNNQTRTIALGGTNTGDNTLAGSIGNAGTGATTLAKNDSGTWVLTGNNSYTGNTVINAGTLKVGNGGTTGSIASANTINLGTLAFDRSDTSTYAGVISDVGNVEQIGTGTTILTGNSIYTGGTTISDGTLQLGNGGASGSIVGNVTDNGELAFNRSDSYTFAGLISGTGTVSQIGTGTTILTADNSYTGGTTISAGTLQLGNGGTSGSITGNVVNNGSFAINRSDSVTFGGTISGSGDFAQRGAGATILTANNSYIGGTTISSGTLQLGTGGTSGAIVGNVANNGTLVFDRSNNMAFDGLISGTGALVQQGSGIVNMTADNSYSGPTTVNAGTLFVNGDQSAATGATSVANGATLGGSGTIGGNVAIATGGTLTAGSNGVGTLTIAGNLVLAGGSTLNMEFGQAGTVGGALNDLIEVGGNLTLDGTLNVTETTLGTFGPGVYRVINYGGTLSDNGLTLGGMPLGSDVALQTSVANQVNLINSAGALLNFWDGAAGPKNNGAVNGGDGIWEAAGTANNWTDSTGSLNGAWDQDGFAIFQGVAGTVTVDNSLGAVRSGGMQFATSGYTITGDAITLTDPQTIIRVGDASAAGAAYIATIDTALTGDAQLVKEDLGTLVLTGANSYTGGTAIKGGTLRIASDANLGDAAGGITINNGTLQTTANLSTNRAVTLDDASTLLTDNGTSFTVNSAVSGTGSLTKAGTGTLVLTGANSYAGGTTIAAGTLQLGNGGTSGSITGNVVNNGTLAINRSDTLTIGGVISGTGALAQLGTGTTVLTGENSYTGGSTITAGTLQVGDGGTSGGIVGDVANNGRLVFNRADDVTFAGVISGSGNVVQNGTGTTDLTGISTYTGDTIANAGELRLANGGQITSTLRLLAGSTSGENGTITVDGTGSKLNITGTVGSPSSAGTNGTGTVNITGGGTVTGGLIQLGAGGTGQGTLNVSGMGSSYVTTAPTTSEGTIWRIGGNGSGTVNVTDGGQIQNSGNARLGALTGGLGTATVSDTGSSWNVDGALQLVNGSLSVLDGGVVRAGSAAIGFTPLVTGNGNVLVAGVGSRLETAAGLTLNAASGRTGVLTIADGGTVAPGSGTLAITGGNAALNIGGAEGAAATAAGTLDADSVTMATATNRINFNHTNATYLFDAAISGAGALNQTGTGTTILTANNSYTGGTTITDGALQLGNGGTTGSIAGDVANDGILAFNRSDDVTFSGLISGTGAVSQMGTGTTILTADNSYTGGTTISLGTLQLGAGGTVGSIVGDVVNDGVLAFNRSNDVTFGGLISGTGAVEQNGAGTTILTGTNSYAGATTVNAGILLINGDQSTATGATSVANGATLGGIGTIGGNVTIADGASLNPGAAGATPGTLTINGNLGLSGGSTLNYDFGQANVPGGPLNDLVTVDGNLTLDGTLNVTVPTGGSFGAGVYRVIAYGGTLTDNGLDLGTMPADSDVFVQTAVANQVNLVNTAGLELSFWDGPAGPKNDGAIQGGTGTWRLGGGSNDWTELTGVVNADYAQDAFAVFMGAAGTVTVDNGAGAVRASGLQFGVDGYVIDGGPLTLSGAAADVRVGDGTSAGAAMTATIAADLTGTARLVKADLGTLVLTGANNYAGGTAISDGVLQLGDGGTTGSILGGVANNGMLAFNRSDDVTFDGLISGTGAVSQIGTGTTILTADNSYAGGTTITAGTLQLGDGGTIGSIVGNVTNNGVLVFNRLDALTIGGLISGTGAVSQIGTGTTILTADNSYAGGTTITVGTLQLGDGGTTGSIIGNIANNGVLAFNRSDVLTFGGLISGTGAVEHNGAGTTILTGTNNYAGTTTVNAGILLVNGDQSAATGTTSVANGGALGGIGTIGGNVTIANDGNLNPGSVGTAPGALTINGNLALASGSTLNYDFGQANVVGGPLNDLVTVGGNLTLDGTLNVATAAGGSFDPGIYRVISYAGALTNDGLTIGTIPSGTDFFVQTSVAQQVNLINTNGLALRFWDGDAGIRNDGVITGGDGFWRNDGVSDNWTLADGAINAPFLDAAFAVFQGTGGTVTVDESLGAINVSGMQFAADDYVIEGDAINLVAPQSVVRVGDGTAAGADITATIGAELAGNGQLVKSDLGTLVLTGTNSYTGGTAINGGTLRIASDTNLGDAAGGLGFNGGTLQTTADLTSDRAVTLTGAGTLLTDDGTSLSLNGAIAGVGTLTKSGTGTLILSGSNAYAGATTVEAGTLLVNGDQSAATGLTSVSSGATLGGSGTIGGNVTIADGATLNPGGADGLPGTFAIKGNLSLAGGSTLNMQFGAANTVGGGLNDLVTVGGDLVLAGTLNVTVPTGGAFDPGIYRVFDYAGTLTNNGLQLGIMPDGSTSSVQTSITGQVNLVNTGGQLLNFWDGEAGPKFDGVVNGGDGIWQNSVGNDNWTNANGAVNAAYTDAAFAIFAGTGGNVTVDGSLGDITASGMQFASDGYVIDGDAITLTDPQSTIRVGDGSTAGADMTATIGSALIGDTQLVKTDAGTLILSGNNGYTGGTAINGGTLQIATDANLGDLAGNVSLNGGTLRTTADLESDRDVALEGAGTILTEGSTTFTLNGALSGTGDLTKDGTGTLLLTSDNSGYIAATHITDGTLAVDGLLGSTVNVGAGGRIEGNGQVGSIVNSGVVAPGRGDIGTLTVAGDYTGNGGTLEIRTVLGDDSSPADRLVVNGATSGSTQVNVINRDGLGAQTVEGIKIIDVAGASNGTFALNGDYVFQGEQAVIAGAYGYRLYKNGVATPDDGDWYLRSALLNPAMPEEPQGPLYQPGVPVYEGYGQNLLALNGLPTLQQRVGNRSWTGAGVQSGTGIWGRIEGSRQRPDAVVSTSDANKNIDTWQMQMGLDTALDERSDGATLIGGITAHYGKANSSVRSIFGDGSIETKGYGLGATLTWYGPQGFYADGQAQMSWFDSDLKSGTLGKLADGNNGKGHAFSMEVGKSSPVGTKITLTPQIQMVYSHVTFDRFVDPVGAVVSADKGDSLKTRGGISIDHQNSWDSSSGDTRRSHVYALANLTYEWLDGTRTDVSGTPIVNRDHRLLGELGLGASYSWGGDRFTIYSEVSADTSIADFGNSYSLKGNAGLRMKF